MANSTLRDFFRDELEEIKPIGTMDDSKLYGIDESVELTKLEQQAKQNGIDLDETVRLPQVAKNGTLLRTPRSRLTANPEIYFSNRVKLDTVENTLTVVTDYRAIKDQSTGEIYTNTVPGYVITKQGSTHKLKAVVNVKAEDFINEFVDSIPTDSDDIKKVFSIIAKGKHRKNLNSGIGLSSLG